MKSVEKNLIEGELVFYISNQRLAVGKVLRRIDKDKWLIKPEKKDKELSKRKRDYIFPIRDYKKYLTF